MNEREEWQNNPIEGGNDQQPTGRRPRQRFQRVERTYSSSGANERPFRPQGFEQQGGGYSSNQGGYGNRGDYGSRSYNSQGGGYNNQGGGYNSQGGYNGGGYSKGGYNRGGQRSFSRPGGYMEDKADITVNHQEKVATQSKAVMEIVRVVATTVQAMVTPKVATTAVRVVATTNQSHARATIIQTTNIVLKSKSNIRNISLTHQHQYV